MNETKLATIDDALIRRVQDRLVEACHPQAVYLFGSAARGEAQPGSDLDVLVVMELEEGATPYEKARELHALFRGWRVPLDIIVRTPEQFEQGRRLQGFIERTAARDGVVLYKEDSS